uniref:Regulator of telomere elongation helicase 1 homolog n=1 Tax=Schistocephalus solidus TaxID=70667 RepID=A0A0X3PHU7_SCHSO
MPIVQVGCIHVDFPYKPYPCQVSYMQNVIDALNERRHAILESPTGTGKTLCLLCASLGWLDYVRAQQQLTALTAWDTSHPISEVPFSGLNKLDNPLIIFSSRTHAQLNQAIQAFRNTAYSSHRIGVLGSRDQLCLLPEVSQLDSNSAKVYQCRLRVTTRTCDFYRNFDANREKLLASLRSSSTTDIEDLVKLGRETRSCPYYLSREAKTDADVLFMPYNYLLDPKIRSTYGIDLTNAVVIFDEAHNIEQVCEDASSATLVTSLLASAIEELRVIGEYIFSASENDSEGPPDGNDRAQSAVNSSLDLTQPSNDALMALGLPRIITLKGQLIELERLMHELPAGSASGLIKPGDYVFELLAHAGITVQSYVHDLELINQIISASVGFNNPKFRRGRGLTHLAEFLQVVFAETSQSRPGAATRRESSRAYRVFIKEEDLVTKFSRNQVGKDSSVAAAWGLPVTSIGGKEVRNVSLSYWCLSPGRAIYELLAQNVRNIILTSGTLYPVRSLQLELGLEGAIVLQNPHVIDREQVHVAVIPKAPDGGTLNSGYAFRDSVAYQRSLGLMLANLFRIIPRGVLVFFPSYALMRKCVDYWQSSDIYGRFLDHKKVFLEPRDKTVFQQVATSYVEAAYSPSADAGGAALISVMRGKASEGLDLSDHASRAVIIVGLPYPPCEDPRVKIKMSYLDERRMGETQAALCDMPTGRQWYKLQAWRAVNQGVGRVIRHIRDYGAIFLCDERFAAPEARSHLPVWIREAVHTYDSFGPAVRDAAAFFRNCEIKYPAPLMSVKGTNVTDMSASSQSLARRNIQSSRTLVSTDFPLVSSQVHVYAKSLADTGADLLSAYPTTSSLNPSSDTEKTDPVSSTSSILSLVYNCPNSQPTQVSQKSSPPERNRKRVRGEDEILESRLLNRQHGTKKLKLVKEHVNPETGVGVAPGAYIKAVKELLLKNSTDLPTADGRQSFADFQVILDLSSLWGWSFLPCRKLYSAL